MKKNIEFKRFVNKKADPEELKIVKSLSKKFFLYLNKKETVEKLKSFHTLGNSSQKIQDVFISHLKELGFESEKKGFMNSLGLSDQTRSTKFRLIDFRLKSFKRKT